MHKKEAAPLDPWIIEEIRKEEERKWREREQPRIDIPNNMPEYDPDAQKQWEKKEKERRRKEEENPRGVEKINLI